jgi:hypothetical protein
MHLWFHRSDDSLLLGPEQVKPAYYRSWHVRRPPAIDSALRQPLMDSIMRVSPLRPLPHARPYPRRAAAGLPPHLARCCAAARACAGPVALAARARGCQDGAPGADGAAPQGAYYGTSDDDASQARQIRVRDPGEGRSVDGWCTAACDTHGCTHRAEVRERESSACTRGTVSAHEVGDVTQV